MHILIQKFGLLPVIVAALGITACAHIPITSLYKLRNFDPITTDINYLRFAVRIPEKLGIPEGGVRMVLGSEHRTRADLQGEFVLEATGEQNLPGNIDRGGDDVYAFRLATDDVSRFNQLRHAIRVEKTHGAQGTLEVSADVCRSMVKLPRRIPISTFVNASETNGYVALLLDVDALGGVDHKAALEMVPICVSQ